MSSTDIIYADDEMLELIMSLPDFFKRDFPERWIKSSVNETPQPRQSFTLSPGDLSCLGSNERNPLKAEAREGQASGSERVIGPG
jgi:hypothetical protein